MQKYFWDDDLLEVPHKIRYIFGLPKHLEKQKYSFTVKIIQYRDISDEVRLLENWPNTRDID